MTEEALGKLRPGFRAEQGQTQQFSKQTRSQARCVISEITKSRNVQTTKESARLVGGAGAPRAGGRVSAAALRRLVCAAAGFLLAVLWFDLMFDVQVVGYGTPRLPEPVLASIAGYYRRVTIEAFPMNRAVAAAMIVLVAGTAWQLARRQLPHRRAAACVLLGAGAVTLAALRVVPNAVQLAARADSLERQSEIARAICRDHVLCLAAVALVVALQLPDARGERDR
jgi:hypothetical protein